MINILFFLCCLVTSTTSQRVNGMQNTLQEDLELERQLKLINKPHVKSIKTLFGYTVDCIDIFKQPAFDHPLPKNHKLQRKPSNQEIIEKSNSSRNSSSYKYALGLETPCPRGSVPIRRAMKGDLIRTKSSLQAPEAPGNHAAGVHLTPQRKYYGVNGTTNILNPRVEVTQSSAALVWVRNGPNEIIAGWHVDPQLYNYDSGTYLFARWTADNYRTGCYNLLCQGYVQIHDAYYVGARFPYTSTFGLNQPNEIYQVQIVIFKDRVTNNWWLNIDNTNIGYFPAELFRNMSSAEQVGWGGRTTTTSASPINPPMGSGQFPNEQFPNGDYFGNDLHHPSYFRFLSYKNESQHYDEPDEQLAQAFSDKPKCYGASYLGYEPDEFGQLGQFLEFGGPGGYCYVVAPPIPAIFSSGYCDVAPAILFLLLLSIFLLLL